MAYPLSSHRQAIPKIFASAIENQAKLAETPIGNIYSNGVPGIFENEELSARRFEGSLTPVKGKRSEAIDRATQWMALARKFQPVGSAESDTMNTEEFA